MSRPVYNVVVQTVWPDGFKSEVRGDAITTTRKTLEALRRAGVSYDQSVPVALRDTTQRVAVRSTPDATITAGLATLNVRCAKEGV
jgi:hypothetical protein|nr:MAG TPA: hypothetical protein [Caudoviricetes sp.]